MKTNIEMAREAGICTWLNPPDDVTERIERFADLVTEQANAKATSSWTLMCKKMLAFEREAILGLVDSYAKNNTDLKDAIRARGNT